MICSDIWHKYHEWYFKVVIRNLRQFWNITSTIYAKYHVQIMLLFVYTTTRKCFVIFSCRYFKLSLNINALSQSNCRYFSCSSIMTGTIRLCTFYCLFSVLSVFILYYSFNLVTGLVWKRPMGDGDFLYKDFNYLQLLYYQFRFIIFSLLFFSFESISLIVFINVSPCQQNPSFASSILVYSRKTVFESSKIFVEHARRLLIYLNPGLIAVRLLQRARR